MAEIKYNDFAQCFLEVENVLSALQDEVQEFSSMGEKIPSDLANEIFRHKLIKHILTQKGEEMYKKSANEIISDGWNYWNPDNVDIVLLAD